MATKTTKAELIAFQNDESQWTGKDGQKDALWYDDVLFLVNGVERGDGFSPEDLKDEDQVSILDGFVDSSESGFEIRSLESFFRSWRKKQSTAYLSISVPKDKLDAVKAAIKAAGGKIS